MTIYDSDRKTIIENPNYLKGVVEIEIIEKLRKDGLVDQLPIGVYRLFTAKEKLEMQINDLKAELAKYKEDVEQVELFGMVRYDYDTKKSRCVEIIEELRVLENQLKIL